MRNPRLARAKSPGLFVSKWLLLCGLLGILAVLPFYFYYIFEFNENSSLLWKQLKSSLHNKDEASQSLASKLNESQVAKDKEEKEQTESAAVLEEFRISFQVLQETSDSAQELFPKFTLTPTVSCGSELDLVIIVRSTPSEHELRKVIRESWAVEAKSLGIQVIFAVGQPPDKNDEQYNFQAQEIIKEAWTNADDMLFISLTDNDENSYLKSVSVLRWAANFCGGTKAFLLTTADSIVFPFNVLTYVRNSINTEKPEIIGKCSDGPGSPDRLSTSRGYVPYDIWPGDFPPYCTGNTILVFGSAMKKMADELSESDLPWLQRLGHIEDVLLTGVIRVKANVKLVQTNQFIQFKIYDVCHCEPEILSVKGYMLQDMKWYWNLFSSKYRQCPRAEVYKDDSCP